MGRSGQREVKKMFLKRNGTKWSCSSCQFISLLIVRAGDKTTMLNSGTVKCV